jgi:hypothetical protein
MKNLIALFAFLVMFSINLEAEAVKVDRPDPPNVELANLVIADVILEAQEKGDQSTYYIYLLTAETGTSVQFDDSPPKVAWKIKEDNKTNLAENSNGLLIRNPRDGLSCNSRVDYI